MKYYSTNHQAPEADLRKAVVKGLAEDRGLYMPKEIHKLPKAFIDDMPKMRFQDIAFNVASAFFGDDVDLDGLQDLVYDTLQFDCPVVKVKENIYSLELFHGPTLAFKDVGARFMARLLQYFIRQEDNHEQINVLVATSGDTGSAVANGFLGVEGIHVGRRDTLAVGRVGYHLALGCTIGKIPYIPLFGFNILFQSRFFGVRQSKFHAFPVDIIPHRAELRIVPYRFQSLLAGALPRLLGEKSVALPREMPL